MTVGEEGQLATKTGRHGEWSTVFGGQQLTAGVHYMEVEVKGYMSVLFVGIARPGLDTADGKDYAVKECMDAWFMLAGYGHLFGNGKYQDDEAGGFEAGDRIGLLLDLDNHSLLFFKNGEKHGPGFGAGSVTGPVVLAMQMYFEGDSGRVVAGAVRPSGYEGLEAVLGAAGKEELLRTLPRTSAFRNSVFGTNAVLKEGEMKKKVSGIFGATWKKRYFAVNSHYLKYYDNAEASKDITDTKVRGTIDLAKCKDIGSKGEEVSVTIEGGEVQMMKASNAKDAEEWASVMKAAAAADFTDDSGTAAPPANTPAGFKEPAAAETVRARTMFVACAGAVVVVCALHLHCC
jgi:hypothetical protein